MKQDKYYLLYITEYGDDWEDTNKELFKTTEDRQKRIERHRVDIRHVHGIEGSDYETQDVDEKELRCILTVDEYCDLFPGVKELLDQFHKEEKPSE